MGVLATLVGLDAEAPPAPPKFADAQAFLDAVKQRYPKGTRIYEHFKIAMAAYGAGPKTTAAKELLVREVSCCFISSPDLAAAFDSSTARRWHERRAPAGACRAGHVAYPEGGAGRHEMGSRSNSPGGRGWELDGDGGALRPPKQPPPASIRHLAAVEPTVEAHDGDARGPRHAPERLRRPRAIAAAMAELLLVHPRRRTSCFS